MPKFLVREKIIQYRDVRVEAATEGEAFRTARNYLQWFYGSSAEIEPHDIEDLPDMSAVDVTYIPVVNQREESKDA